MTAQPIPVVFKSVVIRREAIARGFYGGTSAFDAAFPTARNEAGLSILVAMSLNDANNLFTQLHAAGLAPERDFGLVDMDVGVVIPCDDVKVTQAASTEIGIAPPRFVELSQGYRHQPTGLEMAWHPNLPEQPTAPIALPPTQPIRQVPPRQPVRVVFRSGPVHWFYPDDGDAEDVE